jgi:hypothetical protein
MRWMEKKAKRSLGRRRQIWEDTIEIDLKPIGSEVIEWDNLAQDGTSGCSSQIGNDLVDSTRYWEFRD